MYKTLAALMVAFTMTVSAQSKEDWIITARTSNVVAMYRNVRATSPAQFDVDIRNVYKPGVRKLSETTYLTQMQGVMHVNCMTRTTKVLQDKAYDNKGQEVVKLRNYIADRDTEMEPDQGSPQWVALTDICGDQNIEWDKT